MGLFGLFYTIFVGGARGVKNIKISIENEKRRSQAISEGREKYLDDVGCERLVSDNTRVISTTLWNDCSDGQEGDRVLKRIDNNSVVKNYTKEERDKSEKNSFSKAKAEGKTVYRLGTWLDNHYKSKIHGYRYKDFDTGAIYIIRAFNGVRFYMDIQTGQLIRETDGEIIRNNTPNTHHHNVAEYETLRQRINKEQQIYFERYSRINERNGNCPCGGGDWYEEY